MDLMIIGPTRKQTGGMPRYIAGQIEQLPDYINVTVHDTESPTGSGPIWFIKAFADAVIDAIRYPFLPSAEIVHIHTAHRLSFYRSVYYVLYTAHIRNCPVILHIHGSDFDEFISKSSLFNRFIRSITFSSVDKVIVLSEYWKMILEDQVPSHKITIFPNAVDPSLYSPRFTPHPPHVVFISDLIGRKGILELVEAIDDILLERDNTIRVSIAGRGPFSEKVADLAKKHSNVTYHGYVSEAEKRSLLDEGSIYVLPTHAEGLPIAMLEGMAGGNAILSTTVGSIPEVIEDKNGILINPGDVEELKSSLEELLNSPETVESMARNNRKLIEEQYSWGSIMEQLTELYTDLINT